VSLRGTGQFNAQRFDCWLGCFQLHFGSVNPVSELLKTCSRVPGPCHQAIPPEICVELRLGKRLSRQHCHATLLIEKLSHRPVDLACLKKEIRALIFISLTRQSWDLVCYVRTFHPWFQPNNNERTQRPR
jgi:hypothetical protein